MSGILSKIPRYDPNWNESSQDMELHPSGDYVEFEDCKTAVEAAIAELRQEVEYRQNKLDTYKDCFEQLGVNNLADLVTRHDIQMDRLQAERDSLTQQLAACQWTPITESNLPKYRDEVGWWNAREFEVKEVRCTRGWPYWDGRKETHFRPINAPKEKDNG